MAENVTPFQKAVIQNFQDGRLSELADVADYKTLMAKLKKDANAGVLVALIEDLRGVEDTSEASARTLTAEIDVQSALAAIGSVSMLRHR